MKQMSERQIINVKLKKLYPDAIPFKYTRKGDACLDMFAYEDHVLKVGETNVIKTGIALEIPYGFEGLVRGRSGLFSKGIVCHLGTVDPTYRGDIGIMLTNISNEDFIITKGMRLSQFTVKPIYEIDFEEVNALSETDRGANGYGSSGLKDVVFSPTAKLG